MKRWSVRRFGFSVLALVASGVFSVVVPAPANAGPVPDSVPPLCLVVANSGVNLQLGYCPNGPSDGVPLP